MKIVLDDLTEGSSKTMAVCIDEGRVAVTIGYGAYNDTTARVEIEDLRAALRFISQSPSLDFRKIKPTLDGHFGMPVTE